MYENRYYVYIIIDPTTSQPFYVGKGQGDRMMAHQKEALRLSAGKFVNNKPHHVLIRKILNAGFGLQYAKISENLSNKVALVTEKELIRKYGRVKDGSGILLNISRGGQQGGETCKPVTQYTITGELIREFESSKYASDVVPRANRSYITQCCKGRRVSAGGFLWAYKGEQPRKPTRDRQRKVDQYSLDGELIATHIGITEAANAVGARPQDISTCCRRKVKTVARYIWAYHGEEPDLVINKTKYCGVSQYTMAGTFVASYLSARAASKVLGLVSQNITKCCDGKQSHVGGFVWRFTV